MYLRVEWKNTKDHKHKLAPFAEGPVRVMNTDADAVTIEKADRSVKTVSRSRVVLAPSPCPEKKMKTRPQPTKLLSDKKFEEATLRDVVTSNDDDDDADKFQCDTSTANPNQKK